jgi:hypothetical protein
MHSGHESGMCSIMLAQRNPQGNGRFRSHNCKGLVIVVLELAIIRWTRHQVHIAHQVCSSGEEKAPQGHYKEHTSRSILDIQGLASLRNRDYAQPMDIIDRRVAGPTSPPPGKVTLIRLISCPIVIFKSHQVSAGKNKQPRDKHQIWVVYVRCKIHNSVPMGVEAHITV